MPRRPQWFPVSHDFLNDPELHEMQRTLGREVGPKLIAFWLWILGRLDKHDNHVKFSKEALRSGCKAANMRLESGYKAVELLLESGWIAATKRLESGELAAFEAPNYWKFHRSPVPEGSNGASEHGALLTYPNPSETRLKEKNSMSGTPDGVQLNNGLNGRNYREEAKTLLLFLNEKAKRQYRINDTNLGFIEARLKSGVEVQACKGVIARKAREWLPDEKMQKYLRPETLFNKTKFESYLAEATPNLPPPEGQ